MHRWLVTGGSGFLGRHLLERLVGTEVVTIGRRPPSVGEFFPVDLGDQSAIDRALTGIAPDVVVHLAGRTPPGPAEEFYRSNTMATVHMLDALRGLGRACRVVLVGSAAELGPVPVEDLPVSEAYRCRPAEPYGLSKWLATSAGLAARPPLEVMVARVFNPVGPGLPATQALGRFAGILGTGEGPVRLSVGDLEARRDFVDARDVADALIALAGRGQPGQVYHVGTGRSRRVGEGLDRLITLSGREVHVEVDSTLPGKSGPSDSRADVGRIARDTGWSAVIPWEQSLYDLWAAASGQVRRS